MNMAVGGVIILFVWIFVGTYCDGCIGIIALSTCYKFRALRSRGRARRAGASVVSGHPEEGNLNYPGKDQSRGCHQQDVFIDK